MAYSAARFSGGRRLLAGDLLARYELGRTFLAGLVAANPALSLIEMVGDVEADDFDLGPRSDSRGDRILDVHGILVAGNLVVGGDVHHGRAPSGLSLYVLGDLRARNVVAAGLELIVTGRTTVAEAFCGSGPPGGARLDGGLRASLLISDDYPMLVSGPLEAPVLDVGVPRVGALVDGVVRARHGDAPADVVLNRLALAPPVPGGRFSFRAAQELRARRESLLSDDYRSGRADLAVHRELRWLDDEIRSALAEGRYVVAVELLKAARNRGARTLVNSLQLADALYRTHEPTGDRAGLAEALELLEETLGRPADRELAVAHPRALGHRAAIRLQLTDADDALRLALDDVTQAAPLLPASERPGLSRNIGRWLFERRRYEESLPYLREALVGYDDDGAVHGCLARALWMLDGEQEAVPHATKSLELNPGDDRMWFVRGKCYQVLGDLGRARLDLQTHLDLHPDDLLTVEALLEVALDQDQVELAVARAERFVATVPDDRDGPGRLGRLLHARGLHTRAVPFLRRAVELEPERRASVVDLAVALTDGHATQDLADRAQRDGLRTALRVAEVDPAGDHLPYLRGECMLALGENDAAVRELTAYIDRFPRTGRALASLGLAEAKRGRPMIAARLLEKAAATAPDDVYVELVDRLVTELGRRRPPPTDVDLRDAPATVPCETEVDVQGDVDPEPEADDLLDGPVLRDQPAEPTPVSGSSGATPVN